MPAVRSGEEVQIALRAFVSRWSGCAGSERAEAQTVLNELLAAYGSDRHDVGARFEDFESSAGFMDLHWPEVCIVEVKAPDKAPESARDQVKRCWEESADDAADRPAARWVVIGNFRGFEVWEPGRFPESPRVTVTLDELVTRYEALLFLADPSLQPSFLTTNREMTTAAAGAVAAVYQSLVDRNGAAVPTAHE